MRLTVAIMVCIMALAANASAVTQTSAFTSSNLISTYSELTAVRTISETLLSAPDVNYKANVQADAMISQSAGGGAIVSQELYFDSENRNGLEGMAYFHSHATATQVKDVSVTFSGTSTADIWNDHDFSRIASDSFGLGLAKPGSGEYDFSVSGSYIATSNTVPVLSPTLMWNNERLILEVAFEQDPLKMEGTADFFSQDLNFNYGALNNVATFYGYDFAREIVIDDTTCNSWMSLQHLN